jgi:alpha-tubulin suppressor-like RCC1 family protein
VFANVGRTVRCWGSGEYGALGYADLEDIGDDEIPSADVDVGSVPVTAVAAGSRHTCALLENGAVRCWGDNAEGQLGYGHTDPVGGDSTPASAGDVPVGASVTQVVAGSSHTCALLEGGSVRCWGDGKYGQLGYGNTLDVGDVSAPSFHDPIELGGAATALAAGGNHTCALLEAGTVRCWGLNGAGQLGYGNTENVGDDETPGSVGPVEVFVDQTP